MNLSINEIKNRAIAFSKEWKGVTSERAEAQTFWNEFFKVFGLNRRKVAYFEKSVKKLNNKLGRIDVFWPQRLLCEHKSQGEDLELATDQAFGYFHGLKDDELPKYIIVSDFAKFKLYDLDESKDYEFNLSELVNKIDLLLFVAGYTKKEIKPEDPVNVKAVERMGKLHDALEENGYSGHQLEVYLMRLLFCLFSEDAGIFEKDHFCYCIEEKTKEDGTDLGAFLNQFFEVLDSESNKRQKNLDEDLANLPYVNGKLFSENLRTPALDWNYISPAIFGSMFQSIMNPKERRELGAHYTSEANILKLIKPLFLEDLKAEFEKVKNNKKHLEEFHNKLASLKFLDPACGCGNFLVITYRELRLLELEVIKQKQYLKDSSHQQMAVSVELISKVNVDQMFGIECEEFPARISEVSLWLTDHQMNMQMSLEFGQYFDRLPLKTSATIVHGNSLGLDWNEIVSKKELNYILGNPPFIGKQLRNKEQNEDIEFVFKPTIKKGYGVLDYVCCWYVKAAEFIQGTNIQVAFVSTNSITQGEQVGILWGYLLSKGVKISFAHRTFKWMNEARGKAAVFCVIIGFKLKPSPPTPLLKDEGSNTRSTLLSFRNNEILKALKPYAKEMKKDATPSENELWQAIRNQKLGVKFRRQHVIEQFIVDFYCFELNLVIEVDGEIHEEQKEYDQLRTECLESCGLQVIRFRNEEVLNNIYKVLSEIQEIINKTKGNQVLLPSSFRRGAGGEGLESSSRLYEYETVTSVPQEISVENINPYLIDCDDLIIQSRSQPICDVPIIINGSIPADGGNLLLSEDERASCVEKEPKTRNWIRRYMGAEDFIHNNVRFCFWLKNVNPKELQLVPDILDRLAKVRSMRQASTKIPTQNKAQTPALFTEDRQPDDGILYLAIPRTSSENRQYIPIGFLNSSDVIAANDLQIVPYAGLYHLGIITSKMHMTWTGLTSGRLKSDYRYSNQLTYNNFPWPKALSPDPSPKGRGEIRAVEEAVEIMLKVREKYQSQGSTLADLYNPLLMSADLLEAHEAIDRAVDKCYGKTNFKSELERVKFLFELYKEYTHPLNSSLKGK
jgi:very-short-patch-repair endonuclease